MKTLLLALAIVSSLVLSGCASKESKPGGDGKGGGAAIPARCTPEWSDAVDRKLGITPPSGRGHEIGSPEWQEVVSRKTGVADASGHGPDVGSDEWCRAVDYKVFGRR